MSLNLKIMVPGCQWCLRHDPIPPECFTVSVSLRVLSTATWMWALAPIFQTSNPDMEGRDPPGHSSRSQEVG